ncbi:P-loop containing nucleoside triphosphate hydrolase protein [Delitschia confertaspora ATCC 74209]|uniref:P-loop containing nucleoside triphosphate hydrolase protein n=1 Tax=Delitschia confertaspora ATCC 74209 TaxID=1513339 RepID=A0A9P4JBM7_9PLEO|nr:P-loop containing nucleoside triphosphate hydrolase protein [Delitschia confertaspora ATCC 74209]
MNLFVRHIWALIRKNLLLIVVRKPISTFLRAIAIPLIVVLILAYADTFFSSKQHLGISSPHPIRSLKDALSQSSHRPTVAFVDNGFKDGEIGSVIDSLSRTIEEAGKIAKRLRTTDELADLCKTEFKGYSPCYGAVVFHSSPHEPVPNGVWNYTLRADSSAVKGHTDITNNNNGVQVYTLPLQLAVDTEIISRAGPGKANVTQLPGTINDIIYTEGTEEDRLQNSKSSYLSLCIYIFGVIFSFAMVGPVYHMPAFIAHEREIGMSDLIDTMIPGGSASWARLIRMVSTYVSFVSVYLPSWLAIGIVMSVVVFPKTSHGIPVGYHIFSGLAFCSFSIFAASFFRKSQISGSLTVVVTLLFGVLAQFMTEQSSGLVVFISLIFPSANYTYFVIQLAVWESEGVKVDMMVGLPPKALDNGWDMGEDGPYRLPIYVLWIFLIIQMLVYPVLAFYNEQLLFGSASAGRRFAKPEDSEVATVTLKGFGKTYKPGFFSRIFRRKKLEPAVTGLDLKAYRGQILCFLGPNGSGKSTTLNAVAGQTKVTSGEITIDPTGGFGYAPQANVIWEELTVAEHIRIFSDLKCLVRVNEGVIVDIIKACDLAKKKSFKAKTLSGGQKRKLQLAMMFAGGSSVCCVDEVSTGLDPISRRKIWDILLAERSKRTIIMTTHFLDEADFLADNIAIMYKGHLKAEGTSATLKHRFGNGYTIKLPKDTTLELAPSGPVEKLLSRNQLIYRIESATVAVELLEQLERANIHDYQVSGPTMEELFLKVTGDSINAETSQDEAIRSDKVDVPEIFDSDIGYELKKGKPVSAFKQWQVLFAKRVKILRRSWMPYFTVIAIGIIGAGVSPQILKKFKDPLKCPDPAKLMSIYPDSYRSDLTSFSYYRGDSDYTPFVAGPASRMTEETLSSLADIYSVNHTDSRYYASGFMNATALKVQFHLVDTYDEFMQYISKKSSSLSGGVFFSDPPTIAISAPWSPGQNELNIVNNMLSGVKISTGYSELSKERNPVLTDFRASEFIIIFGLIMACYPAFFALYPTIERLQNVRSMQYSNGVRPVPLWLSHLCFDACMVLIISLVGIGLISQSTKVWYGLPLLWVVLFLYGISSTLLSYIVSMFSRSPIAAWAFVAVSQVAMYFAYFGGILGIQSSVGYLDLETNLNYLYFSLGVFSPAVNMIRALTIGLGQFGMLCNGHKHANAIALYGGPILYLALQSVFLFALLIWWDSGFVLPALLHRSPRQKQDDQEISELSTTDAMAELARMRSPSTDLRVEKVTKRFGRNIAVDDVTFGVQTSEIFALLGPNGAGKSTIISMIRGDIKPSTSSSIITIASHSILTSPISARSSLGVCPQFDAADMLTVTETLQFFARIRGVTDIEHNVSTVIRTCGLQPWANQLAQKLSGGTKRKLSLAVALVGNPPVLVLDEPSSALDASAKRNMWCTLQAVSKGRAVVLTTHSMEEADALADRVGIVSSRLLAIGPREELKRRAGDSYHIHIVSRSAPRTSVEEIEAMRDWVMHTFPGAKLSRETQGGQLRFEVPALRNSLLGLIKVLEAKGY